MTVKIEKKIKGYSVVQPGEPAKAQPENFVTDEADRRMKLDAPCVNLEEAILWASRPTTEEGNDSRTYVVRGPEHRFFVSIGHLPNGTPVTGKPFEILISGHAPRGLNALAKSLSKDMQTSDRTWLRKKLCAVGKTRGKPFVMAMPDGRIVEMPSEVAAFARLVEYRCDEIGAFSENNLEDKRIINALMSQSRPLTTGEGTVAWCADVVNQQTGDKFKVFLPEVELADGTKRPFEVWFDGEFPEQTFRGLAKSLSLDMRVNDLGWVQRKVEQLIDIEEVNGDFWANVPGTKKQKTYPSTIAYVAELILYRFRTLGLFHEHGVKGGTRLTVVSDSSNGAQVLTADAEPTSNILVCPECKSVGSMVLAGGCPTCKECGYSKCS